MSMLEFRKFYSIWKCSMLMWLIPLVILGIKLVLLNIEVYENGFMNTIISYILVSALFIMFLSIFVLQITFRIKMIRSIIGFKNYGTIFSPKPIAFRVDGVEVTSELKDFVNRVTKMCYSDNIIDELERNLISFPVVYDVWFPITFITFKPRPIVVKWTGISKLCAGIQDDKWCEVVWDKTSQSRILQSIKHELAHILLSKVYPKWSGSRRELEIRKAGF